MKFNDITIKVNHFGPLKNVSFKLAPLMVFTGLSSTGKSYANYLVYYFLSSVCNGSLIEFCDKKPDPELTAQQFVFRLDEFLLALKKNAADFMRSFLGDETMECEVAFISRLRQRNIEIFITKEEGEIEHASPFVKKTPRYQLLMNGKLVEVNRSFSLLLLLLNYYLMRHILGESILRSVILPPGRGAFVGENFSLKNAVSSSLGMYDSFFFDFDYAQKPGMRRHEESSNIDLSDQLLKMTSGGHLLTIESKQYLQLDDNQRIALSASASSIKDLSPWLFFLKNHPEEFSSFCLEEPEAHQHPSVTVQIADTIAISLNRNNAFHLTTHSDYLIQRLNQLIRLGGIRRKNEKAFEDICVQRNLNPLCYIDAAAVRAYYFSKDNKGRTVVETLEVTDDGIPMKSFFEVVRDLNEREDYINDATYKLSKEQK